MQKKKKILAFTLRKIFELLTKTITEKLTFYMYRKMLLTTS